MQVYLIRHGESETNLSKKYTGWLDVPLTDKGKEDAKKAGSFLKNISFNKVFASDLLRAVQTAEIALPAYDYEASPLFREINVGMLAGNPLSILSDKQKETIAKCGYAYFDGETKEDFNRRICQALNWFETLNVETVAVFTHAGFLRGVLDAVLHTYLLRKHVQCNNCAIAIFEYSNKNWSLNSWINLS